jgi:O-antigen/teichoic acid export membrane protein
VSLLKKNIIANYVSQIYVTIVGILLLPMYIKYMGSEAYGLVGFFAMLQVWFGVLDLGLTPTVSREMARFKGRAVSALAFRQLYRALTVIFVAVAVIGGSALFISSTFLATQWLNLASLPVSDVVMSLQIMAVIVALRWMSGLYRGVVTGSEKLVWLSAFNAIIATLRFIGVFVSMWCFGFTPLVFFIHQLVVALIEIISLGLKSQQLLPQKSTLNEVIGWSFSPVKSVLKFSLTIAFTAAVWVFVTQTDKLVLSGILSLEDYGYFTLAVLVANGIMIIGGPISNAIMPRMTRLYAENLQVEMIQVYRQSTQLVAVIAGTAAITLAVTSKSLLIAWTGDEILAIKAAPILQLYAIGNGLLTIASFAYYLQYAKGNLRYHLFGNLALAVLLIPSVIFVASHFGAIGAGYVWVILNIIFLFLWVAYIHKKLEPNLHVKWLFSDVIKIILPSALMAIAFAQLDITLVSRVSHLLYVVFIGTLVLSGTLCFSFYRSKIFKYLSSI